MYLYYESEFLTVKSTKKTISVNQIQTFLASNPKRARSLNVGRSKHLKIHLVKQTRFKSKHSTTFTKNTVEDLPITKNKLVISNKVWSPSLSFSIKCTLILTNKRPPP